MKYIKEFENKKDKPSIGDYVVCDIVDDIDKYLTYDNNKLSKFLSENIGIIDSIRNGEDSDYKYVIRFKNTDDVSDYTKPSDNKCINVNRGEIKFYSSDISECEVYLSAIKYNL